MLVIAVDPGLNVGIAYKFPNGNFGTATMPNQPDWDTNMQALLLELDERKPDIIVFEGFTGRQAFNKFSIETTEMVGAIRGFCLLKHIAYVKQMPGDRIMRVPSATRMLEERRAALRAAGEKWTFTNHEVSALAHLLTWEINNDRPAVAARIAASRGRAAPRASTPRSTTVKTPVTRSTRSTSRSRS